MHVTDPREALDNLTQKLKEGDSIRICEEDSAAIVAATGDVVESTFEFDSQRPCHGFSLAQRTPKIKT